MARGRSHQRNRTPPATNAHANNNAHNNGSAATSGARRCPRRSIHTEPPMPAANATGYDANNAITAYSCSQPGARPSPSTMRNANGASGTKITPGIAAKMLSV